MRAALLKEPYKMALTTVDPIQPGPGEVLIKVNVTGICGSEIHAYKGTHPFRHAPTILGHELAGDIVETGAEVKSFNVGDRVTVEPQITCGECDPCRRGFRNLCRNKTVLGTQTWIGSFAEYIVAPESVVYRLPDNLSYAEGAMVEPLAVGVHAVARAGLGIGDEVLILGGGTIGLATAAAAKVAGCRRIIVTDVVDFNVAKALEVGATHSVNVATESLEQRLDEITESKGVDIAFVTIGVSPVVQQALQAVRRRGTVVVIALFEGPVTFDMFGVVGSEVNLIGSQMYDRDDFLTTIDLVSSGRIDATPFISKTMPFDEIARGMEIVDTKAEDVVKVQLVYGS